ncbi:MAG: DUF2238 domain-containing protein [Myxococcaceae bacterium]|nr:DUF2238 domain-containing protein [Myxococcaceae bacterium]
MTRNLATHVERRVPIMCLAVYVVALVVSGISPHNRNLWLFENVCPVIIIALAVITYRRFRFSDRAYLQGLVFLLLHTVATYYTYPRVPLGVWVSDWLDLSRNPYDRIIHFSYGLLILRPIREVAFRREPRKNLATELFLSVAAMWFFATGYELLEWWGALVAHPRDSKAFLGIQGDPWDVQQDLFVAVVGAALACGVDVLLERAGKTVVKGRTRWRLAHRTAH